MVRNQFVWAALALLGLSSASCIRERNFESYPPEPEAISFVLGSYMTRSEAEVSAEEEVRVNRYSLGDDGKGNLFTLEETVTRLDDGPATRGTPAYTENVQDVHGSSFRGITFNTQSGATVDDGEFTAMEDGVRWRRVMGFDPWASAGSLAFLLTMPSASASAGISNLAYDKTAGTFSFDFETPETAAGQQDILFASRVLTHDAYDSEQLQNGGAGILFRHALTGVKFAIGNNATTDEDRMPENQVETFITKVEITGLVSRGSAVFNQDDSQESVADNRQVYSSRSSFTWTPDNSSTDAVFTQTYEEDDIQDFELVELVDENDQPTGQTGYDESDKVHGPDSFYEAGNLRNLNKSDASLTFWFIPQQIGTVKVRVTFYVWDGISQGEEFTRELELGTRIASQEKLTNKEWRAGELRTFTLKPTAVDVEITEELDENDETILAAPFIRNTGNKDAYIRAVLVGNWVDAATGEIPASISETDPDTEVTTVTYLPLWTETNTSYGTFTNLPTNNTLWVKKSDGFWYFTQIVPPGKLTGETMEEGSTHVPLFGSYTKGTPPASGLNLMLDVAVQAVDANAGADYEAAWQAVGAL